MTAMKKTGSLLSRIMLSRDQAAAEEEATPAPAAPIVVKAPQPAPVPAKPPGPPAGPMHLVGAAAKPSTELAEPGAPTPKVGKGGDAEGRPSAQLPRPHKVKKSYSIKSTNLEAIELLAWFWDKPDSQVVDQALDLLVQSMGKEVTAAMELRSAKLKQRPAV